MKPVLVRANLYYGSTTIPVRGNDSLPLPQEFDVDNAEECARKIAAMMSNAAGGFTLINVRCSINKELGIVSVIANGAGVFYKDEAIAAKAAADMLNSPDEEYSTRRAEQLTCYTTMELGDVSTSQYANGWQNPLWTKSENDS